MIEVRKSIVADGRHARETAVARARRRLKKIIDELTITRELTGHENIIQYINSVETSHRICIAYELVQGHDLLEFLLTNSKMEEPLAACVISQLLSALQHCHEQQIWHRDLKLEK
jgi:serine/threonine protein kinase